MNKHKLSAMQTRQKLIDAFWALYTQKRIEKITVSEITTLAGCNRCTFYEHFADVYAVLESIEDSLIPEIDELPPLDITSDTPIDTFINMYSNKYYSVLLGENGDPSFSAKLKNSLKQKLIAHLTDGENQIELDYRLEFILSAMIGIFSYWIKQNNSISKEKLVSLILDIMKNGSNSEIIVSHQNT